MCNYLELYELVIEMGLHGFLDPQSLVAFNNTGYYNHLDIGMWWCFNAIINQ